MNGFSRILLEEHATELSEEARRYVNLVQSNAAQMGNLVDDLLAFSHVSRQGDAEATSLSIRAGPQCF